MSAVSAPQFHVLCTTRAPCWDENMHHCSKSYLGSQLTPCEYILAHIAASILLLQLGLCWRKPMYASALEETPQSDMALGATKASTNRKEAPKWKTSEYFQPAEKRRPTKAVSRSGIPFPAESKPSESNRQIMGFEGSVTRSGCSSSLVLGPCSSCSHLGYPNNSTVKCSCGWHKSYIEDQHCKIKQSFATGQGTRLHHFLCKNELFTGKDKKKFEKIGEINTNV